MMQDALFWPYLDLVIRFDSLPSDTASWAEGCACHEDLLQGHRSSKRRRQMRVSFADSCGDCKMKGKRLPELAVGALDRVFTEITDGILSHMQVKSRIVSRMLMSPEQWGILMRAFHAGKSLLWSALQVKMDFAKKCPWRLAALVHHDTAIARAAGKDIVREFDQQESHVQDIHHPLTLQVLRELRLELNAFLDGAPLQEQRRLQAVLLPLQFIPIAERHIEAGHSLVKRLTP